MRCAARPLRTVAGFSMVEVLVTMIVLALGLLGLAGLQARAQQADLETYQRAQALLLAEDMASRLRLNRPFRACYDLDAAGIDFVGTAHDFSATGCDARADEDLEDWDRILKGGGETLAGQNVGAMIGARGCIRRLAANRFVVTVAWQGLTQTAAVQDECASGLYGSDAARRVVQSDVRFAVLN